MNDKTLLVTGVSGFLGRAIAQKFSDGQFNILGTARQEAGNGSYRQTFVRADIRDAAQMGQLCREFRPDIVVHCAGIAHQSFLRPVPDTEYDEVNNRAAVALASSAAEVSPGLHFIFLSSVSVYGDNYDGEVCEESECRPVSAYAKSKLAAEAGLSRLFDAGKLQRLDILRLAPSYDYDWRLNLDKRIYTPGKLFFLKYGDGSQRMSVLARQNLVDLILYLSNERISERSMRILNVSDAKPTTFNELIRVSNHGPFWKRKLVCSVPVSLLKGLAGVAGSCMPSKKTFFRSCLEKLTCDFVIDNRKMLATGFHPVHTLGATLKRSE